MACAVKAGIPRFIFSSTAAVYGEPETQPVTEDAAPEPISPYGSSKLMTEWMLQDAHAAHGLHTWRFAISTSPAPIEGPHRPVHAARHAPDQGRLPGRAWPARRDRVFGTD